MSGISTNRSLTYWGLFLAFLLVGGPILTMDVTLSEFHHNVLDGVSALVAIVATIVLFLAYRRTRATLLLIAAHAFAACAAIELLHELSDSAWLAGIIVADPEYFMPWSWVAARMFLAGGLLLAALHATRENFGDPATVDRKGFPNVYAVTALVVVSLPATIYGLMTMDLPSIYYSSVGMLRFPDIISGLISLVALILFVRKGNWRTDSYSHYLNIALLLNVGLQLFCMGFSQEFLDSSFGAAHFLKIVAYGFVIYGFSAPHKTAALSEADDRKGAKGLGIGVKVGVVCGFIGIICVIPVAIYSSTNLHKITSNNGMEKLSLAAVNTGRKLENQRRRINMDLNNLVSAKSLGTRANKQGLVRELKRLGQSRLIADKSYLSLAYIDTDTGETLFRLEQTTEADLAENNRLQLQASELNLGSQLQKSFETSPVAHSKVMLLDNDAAAGQGIPAEGFAVAVYQSGVDAPVGALVAHTDISAALNAMPLLNAMTQLYVFDDEGRVISGPLQSLDAEGIADLATISDLFPDIEFEEAESFDEVNGSIMKLESGQEMLLGFSRDEAYAVSGEPLLYVYTGSRNQMEAVAVEVGENLQRIAQFNLLIAIVLGWFFARRIATPVQKISEAAVEFGRSGTVMQLPKPGRDEIGLLTKSLSEMMYEVSSQRQKLILLSSAVESSVESMLITNINGVIQYVNPEYERYAGVIDDEIIGKNIMDLDEFKNNRNILSESRAKKGNELVWVGEMRNRRSDGNFHDELVTIAPIRNADGEQINQSMILEDITVRKEMERFIGLKTAELERSNRDLEQFAYVASHDLKAPLRAIEVLVSWLKDDLEEFEGGDVHENLDLLEQRTARLSRLLVDLLEYSRSGRKIGGVKTIDTKEFVEDIATLIAPPEGFVIEIDENLPKIVTHHAPFETVFRNLISNAIKHSPDGSKGRIRISAVDRGDKVEFAVQDNGTGIPQEYADKVFKMFQTLKARDEMEGSGMGLAIVKRIIDWQLGAIWFEDGPDNVGTVFKFTWSKCPVEMPVMDAEESQAVSADEPGLKPDEDSEAYVERAADESSTSENKQATVD
jgi:PAS domain S-box-containing protein